MADRDDTRESDVLVLASAFESLRGRGGLTIERLSKGKDRQVDHLLAVVADKFENEPPGPIQEVALEMIVDCVKDRLVGEEQVIADAVLGLGIFVETYARKDIEAASLRRLQADAVGLRREALLNQWPRLLRALKIATVDTPSDRVLRGTKEPQVFKKLAQCLLAFTPRTAVTTPPRQEPTSSPQVIVIGGVCMDATFRTQALPESETSIEAEAFDLAPGGKGFYQALAVARLGLDVALIAKIADDRFGFGEWIIDELRAAHVDTSLIVRTDPAKMNRNAMTGVVEMDDGTSVAFNWRNDLELNLLPKEIDTYADRLMKCSALLATFEVPPPTLRHALDLAHTDQSSSPVTVVTPGQPYTKPMRPRLPFRWIDFLVAYPWELRRYAQLNESHRAPAKDVTGSSRKSSAVARRLVSSGIGTVCRLDVEKCDVFSSALGDQTVRSTTRPSYLESSLSRDAFCAALTGSLLENDREFGYGTVQWAMAARSYTMSHFAHEQRMPDRSAIRRVFDNGSAA